MVAKSKAIKSAATKSGAAMDHNLRADATRPVSAGTKHRGDRRDMSKAYTGNARNPARGNTPRIDVKTRKR